MNSDRIGSTFQPATPSPGGEATVSSGDGGANNGTSSPGIDNDSREDVWAELLGVVEYSPLSSPRHPAKDEFDVLRGDEGSNWRSDDGEDEQSWPTPPRRLAPDANISGQTRPRSAATPNQARGLPA
eukprot:COSAG01_NODE_12657_length_1703_cov_1.253117_1_plen_127_part_00